MKESKIASFKNVSFGADFENGLLVTLSVIDSHVPNPTLDNAEVSELHGWLSNVVGSASSVLVPRGASPVLVEDAVTLNPRGPNFVPLEDRGGSVKPNGPHMTDAESVKNRVPLEKALSGGGMLLESRDINPIEVRIQK